MPAALPSIYIDTSPSWLVTIAMCMVLPASIYFFRWALTSDLTSGVMAMSLGLFMRLIMPLAAVILLAGFVAVGFAIQGRCHYTLINDESITQSTGLYLQKQQVWKDLDAVRINGNQMVTLQFRENGRYRVELPVYRQQFSDRDWQAFLSWLNVRFEDRMLPAF